MAHRFLDYVRRLIAYSLALVLTAASAHAEPATRGPSESEPPVPSDLLISDWRLGPFYVKPMFALRDVGYDTNILNAETAEKDYTFVVAPGVRLALPVGEGMLSVTQEVSYSYFRDLVERRGWYAATTIATDLRLGSLSLKAREAFRKTDEYYSDEILSRPRRIENQIDVELATAKDSGLYFEADFSHHVLRFDSEELIREATPDLGRDLDRTDYRGSLVGFLDALAGGRLILGGSADRYAFRSGGPGRDARNYFVFSGLRFDAESAITGDLRVGYERREVGDFAHPDLSGLAFSGSLRFELGGASWFELQGSRRTIYSDYSVNGFAVSSGGGFTLGFVLGDAFELEIRPRLGKLEYPRTLAEASGGALTGSYDSTGVEIRGSVAVSGGVRLALGLLYRDLDGVDRAYDGYALTTGLSYGR